MKESAYMIEFHGGMTVRRSPVKADGFVRHPFDLIDFDDLQVSNNKYLIDVVGYVTNVGRSTKQRTGSKTLDFYLTNQRTGANQLGHTVGKSRQCVDRKENKECWSSCRDSNFGQCKALQQLYLSSSSSTLILDDAEIPAMKEFTSDATSVTFNCQVIINNIRTRKGWNYPLCGSDKCKKGVTRKEGKFWCDACNKHSEYPVVRYRLELDIYDDTANTMVVMFDETATELVKFSAESLLEGEDEDQPALPQALTSIIGTSQTLELKSHTYYEHGAYESFTCWYICAPESVDESAGSSTVSAGFDIGKPKLKRLFKSPLVSTPSKPSEDKRKKMLGTVLAYTSGYQITLIYVHSDTEITAAGSEVPKDEEDGEPASKKKKKRYIMEDSESE
ncbi:hypothetical protein OROHE_014876 [Orobanche hederae]